MNAVEAIRKVESEAKQRAKPDTITHETMAVGEYHRQGDVYFTRLKAVPSGAESMELAAQIVPGNTQGSRHVLSSLDGVTMFRRSNSRPLDGPVVKCKTPIEVTHPEHGHVVLPAGVYSVNFQRQYAEELKRVAD